MDTTNVSPASPASDSSPSALPVRVSPEGASSAARLSVIVAVYDRADLLRGCMESLARQEGGLEGVEVWVVGDGSPNVEDMRLAALEPLAGTGVAVRFERRPKGGPGVQRNWAARQATAPVFLFLNDDIEFGSDYLASHLAAHARRPGHGVVGNTRWHPEVVVTPFMHWVAHNDFFYFLIHDREDIGWEYVHTLNFSIHRRWFDEDPEGGFCEAFPDPAFEDTEWALRLHKRGLKVAFAPEALVLHRHFYEERGYWAKSAMKGASARLLIERHPEIRDRILGPPPPGALAGWRRRLRLRLEARIEGSEGPGIWEEKALRLFREGAV